MQGEDAPLSRTEADGPLAAGPLAARRQPPCGSKPTQPQPRALEAARGGTRSWHSLPTMLLRVLVLLGVTAQLAVAPPFLPALELDAISFTPAARASVSGRDAITVTFNRAVIALGSDFGAGDVLPADKVPFSVTVAQVTTGARTEASMDGRWRWVTTFVARFDPAADWPTDVTVNVQLNSGLTTWDGSALAAAAVATRAFVTPQISSSLRTVRSAQAAALTGDAWTAGYSDPREVPPDGIIELGFSRPVDPALVGAALRLELAPQPPPSPSGVAPPPPPPVAADALVVAACTHASRPPGACDLGGRC